MDHAFQPAQPGSTKCKWCNFAESAHRPAEELEKMVDKHINDKSYPPKRRTIFD